MNEKTGIKSNVAEEVLRLEKERLQAGGEVSPNAITMEDSLRLLEELRVHQVELEMQNEELRRAREEREMLLEKYTDLYDFAPVSYFTLDRSGVIISANLTGASFLGINRSLLSGRPFKEFVAGEARHALAGYLERVFAGRTKEACELVLLTDGSTPRFVRTEAVADSSGEECRIALTDISERALAEDELQAREEKFRRISQQFNALLDTLPDGIAQITPDFKITWANRSLTELVEADELQLKGNCCYQALWDFRVPCASCPVARSFHSGELEEGSLSTSDGRLMELRAVPIYNGTGKVESVIVVIRDITEHRKLEGQLRQAQKMESIGTLAGGIAHDFNNILTAIVGYGYIALMNMGADDPQRKNIEHIIEGTDRAAQLTKDLLIFSRKQVGEKIPVDLNEIIGKVEKFLRRVIGEDINFTLGLCGEPLIVSADAHQLEQVLMNLATNARDAMAAGGNLTVSTARIVIEKDFITIHGYGKPGCYALVTISDTGEGMDEETRAKIFEPFFTTKEVGKGTGLGLAVVYGIVKQHDGYINVYSELGSGTTFRIYLPLVSSQIRGEELEPEKEIAVRGTETILLAEDDESVRDLVSMVLKEHGYTVIVAVNGADAVNRFKEQRESIQLLISDLIMPKMNGKEAYDEMRALQPGMKAIFVSGYAPDFIRQKMSFESGLSLISKPIQPHALLRLVRRVLDE